MKNKIELIPGDSINNTDGIDMSRHIYNYRGPGIDCNSHILKRQPILHSAYFIPGLNTSWYEYVPSEIDMSKSLPLVISRHGGVSGGLWQAYTTSWCEVAEREGFIVVFPNADWENRPNKDNRWPYWSGSLPTDADASNIFVREMIELIEHLKRAYNIDTQRIFMQGHSVGDMQTLQFALACGGVLAGIAGTTGPVEPTRLISDSGELAPCNSPVPAVISFCENNDMLLPPSLYPDPLQNKELTALRYWRTINEANGYPRIGISGDDIYVYYKGEHADVMYHEVWGRSHSMPFDEAEMLWSTFFSCMRRMPDGSIRIDGDAEDRSDRDSVAIAAGARFAYVNNIKEAIDEYGSSAYAVEIPFAKGSDPLLPPIPEERTKRTTNGYEDVIYVPVTFISKLGAHVTVEPDGRSAKLVSPSGDTLEVFAGNIGVVWNDRLRSMFRHAEHKNGVLYVPLKWIAGVWLNKFVSQLDGVLYVSNRYGLLTRNLAAIITELLG